MLRVSTLRSYMSKRKLFQKGAFGGLFHHKGVAPNLKQPLFDKKTTPFPTDTLLKKSHFDLLDHE